MSVVITFIAVLAVLGALVAWVVFLVGGIVDLSLSLKRGADRQDQRLRATGAVKLLGAVGLLLAPLLAAPLAEANSGWTDPDGDGMYAQMVNGSYDWLDINGGSFARLAALIAAGVIGSTLGSLWLIRHCVVDSASDGWADTSS